MIHVNCRNSLNLLALAVSMVLSVAARADEPVAPTQQAVASEELENVTVYARRLVPATRVAATVTVITDQQIQATLAGDVKQMVRYEPGLSVGNDPFRFGLDTFTIRGMTGNRVAVDVDGIPSAPGFAIGSYSNSGRAFVDLALVQRVEILRGPASSLYGSDAIGGVVAMTTFRPDALLGTGAGPALRTAAGYDSSDDGWNAVALAADRFGATDVIVGYVHRQGHEADTAASVTPNPSDYGSDSMLLTAQFDSMPGGPLTVTAEGGRLHQQTDVDAWEELAGSRFVNTVVLKGDDTGDRFRTSVAQQLSAATAAYDTANWVLYWQGTDTRQDTYEQRKAVPPPRPGRPGTPPLAINRSFRFEEQVVGAEFTAQKDLERGSVAHDVVYGLEVSGTRLEELRNGTQADLTTGTTTKTILGETYPLRDFPDSDVVEAGAFAQDEIRFGGGQWSVIPALRIDYYDLSPKPDHVYREDNPRTPVVGLTDTSVSPKLGLTRRMGEYTTAYFQYSNGFRAPPPEDVNIGLDLPLLNIRAIPNPDLKPEKSNGYEVGARFDDGALRFAVAGYWNDYDNFIESKVNLGADPVTHVIIFQSQNVERARIYGTEVSAAIRAGAWAPALDGWTARLAAAWSKGEDLDRKEPLNSVDPGSALVSIAYDAPSGAWRGELVTTAVAAKREVDRSRADLYGTDSYVTLDLLGQADLGHGLTLDAGVFNLTNQAYIQWADVRGRPVGDPLIPYYTNPGRNVSVTLRWRY
ncbi:MAG TPA: TonB-dependent hemoglobin/transferrin/lactoferrin family receptor, partial [Steroidobacteraceae bacterium]|nr:TonB-dependent hemoglobin/transferrin/lactoferrin family receptor [Steroidobacteraceae bacterium]